MELRDVENLNYPAKLLRAIGDQAAVHRYGVRHVIKSQTVGEHTGRACQIMVMVINDLRKTVAPGLIPPEAEAQAMFAIALHDVAESVVSDIPYPVKKQQPVLEHMENDVLAKLISGLDIDMQAAAIHLPDPWNNVVKMVDMAELVVYCSHEVVMGNRTMLDLLKAGVVYLGDLYDRARQDFATNEIPTIQHIRVTGTHTYSVYGG